MVSFDNIGFAPHTTLRWDYLLYHLASKRYPMNARMLSNKSPTARPPRYSTEWQKHSWAISATDLASRPNLSPLDVLTAVSQHCIQSRLEIIYFLVAPRISSLSTHVRYSFSVCCNQQVDVDGYAKSCSHNNISVALRCFQSRRVRPH